MDTLDRHLRDPALKRIFFVGGGQVFGREFVELRILRSRRTDVKLIVVTAGPEYDVVDSGGSLTLERTGQELTGRVSYSRPQVFFSLLGPSYIELLRHRPEVSYGPLQLDAGLTGRPRVSQSSLSFTLPGADRCDYLVVGFGPASSIPHVYAPGRPGWRPASEDWLIPLTCRD
jgi:hypothetical protein